MLQVPLHKISKSKILRLPIRFFTESVVVFLTDETGKVLECDDISVIHFRKIIVDKNIHRNQKVLSCCRYTCDVGKTR